MAQKATKNRENSNATEEKEVNVDHVDRRVLNDQPTVDPTEEAEVERSEVELHDSEESSGSENGVQSQFVDLQEVAAEIKECESIIENTVQRKEQLRKQLQNRFTEMRQNLDQLQSQFGDLEEPKRRGRPVTRPGSHSTEPAKRGRPREGKSIRQCIEEFMENKREARTSEIRRHLEGLGKQTNPGVELSRMVRDKVIVPQERGVYAIAPRR